MFSIIEREWVLLSVDNGCAAWNLGNPIVERLPDQGRHFIMELVSKFCGTSEDVEIFDREEFTMNGRWLSPTENIVNCSALAYIGMCFPHLLASIEGVLQESHLPGDLLSCLDEDDFSRLTKNLVEIASSAIINGNDKREALRLGLIEWLQEWSGSESDELAELVGETRVMRGVSPYVEEEMDWVKEVDWVKEGF